MYIHICISVDCCWSVFLLLAKMLLEKEKNLLLDCSFVRSAVTCVKLIYKIYLIYLLSP